MLRSREAAPRENPVADEAEANDYDSPDDALAGAAKNIGAEWYIRDRDSITVYMRSPDGYYKAELFKKGGWYHWPTDWADHVQNLPHGAKQVPGIEAIYRQERGIASEEDYQENPRGPRCGPDLSTGHWRHRGGCCPGRPTCRYQRREAGICHCEAYHYPHRVGSGRCLYGPEGPERMDRYVHGPAPENDAEEGRLREYGKAETVVWHGETIALRPNYPADDDPDQSVFWSAKVRGGSYLGTSRADALKQARAGIERFLSEPQAHEARDQEEPAGEAAAVPWVKLERDPAAYRESIARAKEIGKLNTAKAVFDFLGPHLAKEDQEVFIVIAVDARGQCRGPVEVHRGGQSRVAVEVPVIMRTANALGGEMFIVVHNHPTSHAKPSKADRELTKTILDAAHASQLVFMDHVIIGLDEYYSFADNNDVLGKLPRRAKRSA